eukprot:11584065-Alexandrium_andersonii.AAC.1
MCIRDRRSAATWSPGRATRWPRSVASRWRGAVQSKGARRSTGEAAAERRAMGSTTPARPA